MRTLFYVFLTFVASQSFADVRFQRFNWRADNTVDLQLQIGASVQSFKVQLHDGETTSADVNGSKVTIISFTNTFVALVINEAGQQKTQTILLERWNSSYVPLTGTLIGTEAELRGAIDGLREQNKWDHALAIRSLVSYISVNPGRDLATFHQAVLDKQVVGVAKPLGVKTDRPTTRRRSVPEVEDSEREQLEARRAARREQRAREEAERGAEPQRPMRDPVREARPPREPLPYEPRFKADTPPTSGQFPGQSIGRERRTERPRRETKPFNFLFGN